MGNLEGKSFWWKAPPFHFDYEYDGKQFEYSIWQANCFEEDINCIEDAKIWAIWQWGGGLVACVILCCLKICLGMKKG